MHYNVCRFSELFFSIHVFVGVRNLHEGQYFVLHTYVPSLDGLIVLITNAESSQSKPANSLNLCPSPYNVLAT